MFACLFPWLAREAKVVATPPSLKEFLCSFAAHPGKSSSTYGTTEMDFRKIEKRCSEAKRGDPMGSSGFHSGLYRQPHVYRGCIDVIVNDGL